MSKRPRFLARAVVLAVLILFAASACQTNTGTTLDNKRTQGAIIGGLAGAAAGRAIGGHENAAAGILIGGAAGALAGGLIGHYLQKQAQEFDAIPDANVERREESLIVTLPGDVLFESGSAALSPGAYERLRTTADILNRYPDTVVIIKGHTDSAGSSDSNLELSERRADSVRNYLVGQGVASHRISAVGMGEAFPVASNDTPVGRQMNRRVELEVRPNDSLRERAVEDGAPGTPPADAPY